jgi:hypothetical protein
MTLVVASSLEVRWFMGGPLPQSVVHRFQLARLAPLAEPIRTDCYLRPPSTDAVGIKVRGGKVEHKLRQEVLGMRQFAEGVAGCVERWRKGGFSIAPAAVDTSQELARDSAWILVEKERWLRAYTILDGSQAEGVPAGELPWPFTSSRLNPGNRDTRVPRSGLGWSKRPGQIKARYAPIRLSSAFIPLLDCPFAEIADPRRHRFIEAPGNVPGEDVASIRKACGA